MPIDYSLLTFGKGHPAALTKHRKRATRAQRLAAAYREVDRRDGGYCVVTGAYTVPGAADPKRRREHHHLKGRRVRPAWVCRPERIITVSAFVHELLQRNALHVEGADARTRLFFHWNRRIVPAGQEPFRLKKRAA